MYLTYVIFRVIQPTCGTYFPISNPYALGCGDIVVEKMWKGGRVKSYLIGIGGKLRDCRDGR